MEIVPLISEEESERWARFVIVKKNSSFVQSHAIYFWHNHVGGEQLIDSPVIHEFVARH